MNDNKQECKIIAPVPIPLLIVFFVLVYFAFNVDSFHEWMNELPKRTRYIINFSFMGLIAFSLVFFTIHEKIVLPYRQMLELGRSLNLKNRAFFWSRPRLSGKFNGRNLTVSQHEISVSSKQSTIVTIISLELRMRREIEFELESTTATGGDLLQQALAFASEQLQGKLPQVVTDDQEFNRLWVLRGKPEIILREWLQEDERRQIRMWREGSSGRQGFDFALQSEGKNLELVLGSGIPDVEMIPDVLRELVRLADRLEDI